MENHKPKLASEMTLLEYASIKILSNLITDHTRDIPECDLVKFTIKVSRELLTEIYFQEQETEKWLCEQG